ncbi:MAG: hypothetical protein M1834_005635 [Cirrosporium novae-zelandiae]|nr:MAG: hypothetical protein M1834_005635 [Cirrosporium novae-zelandiae]
MAHSFISIAAVLLTLSSLLATTSAHSWVEQMTVIASNGTFVGAPGYARGNVQRDSPGFSDPTMVYLLPPNGGNISSSDFMCKSTQQTQNQTDGSPRLQATAGDYIALRHQENGHVTLPQNQPGKPANRGTVYVYGTTEPKSDEKFLDVHGRWTADGSGGDKRGVLLTKQNFDDGRCYQINSGTISTTRQKEFPHTANALMGADLWCQVDLQLPTTTSSGKTYTLYWVWDWPTAPNVDPALPEGKQETYTTCMDIDMTASDSSNNSKIAQQMNYVQGQGLDNAAIPSELTPFAGGGASATASTNAIAASSAAFYPNATTGSEAQTTATTQGVPIATSTSTLTVTPSSSTRYTTIVLPVPDSATAPTPVTIYIRDAKPTEAPIQVIPVPDPSPKPSSHGAEIPFFIPKSSSESTVTIKTTRYTYVAPTPSVMATSLTTAIIPTTKTETIAPTPVTIYARETKPTASPVDADSFHHWRRRHASQPRSWGIWGRHR